jgi:hypothetical protein
MTSDPRDYKLDITSARQQSPAADVNDAQQNIAQQDKPFLSVLFKCCSVYQRIYRNAAGDKYEGRCPRCGRPVRFIVAPGGTNERSFVVE